MKPSASVEPAMHFAVQLLEGPLADLRAIYSALLTTSLLSDAERGGRVKMISCACVSCGQKIPATEVRRIAEENAQLHSGPDIPGVERCGNCECTEFQFRIQPDSARHWVRVKERLAQTAPEVREVQIVIEVPQGPIPKERWILIGGAVLVGTVLFFLVRYWILGSPIPLIHKPTQYKFELAPPPPEESGEPEIFKAGTRDRD